jgi:hypothetical protein
MREENAGKPKTGWLLLCWFCPSTSTTAKVGRHPLNLCETAGRDDKFKGWRPALAVVEVDGQSQNNEVPPPTEKLIWTT